MTYRTAIPADSPSLCQLLYDHMDGKADPEACRHAARNCITRTRRASTRAHSWCLVAWDDERSEMAGFIAAESVRVLGVAKVARFVSIDYLIGRNCAVGLLRELRKRTQMRIIWQVHGHWGRIEAYRRLARLALPEAKQTGALIEI